MGDLTSGGRLRIFDYLTAVVRYGLSQAVVRLDVEVSERFICLLCPVIERSCSSCIQSGPCISIRQT